MVEDRKALKIHGLRERRFNPLLCYQVHDQCILICFNVVPFSPSYDLETELPVKPDGIQVPFPHFQKEMDCILLLEEVNGVVQEVARQSLFFAMRGVWQG